ncbi:lysosome-associated membrane glycoprotein 3 [Rhinophrynus dorsalis]
MLLRTDTGYSVTCKNTPTIKLNNNMSLTMSNVKLQAFDIHDDEFAKATTCYYDKKHYIILGIVIAAVVVIVVALIIYLIYHNRRPSGYQRI